MTQRLSMKEHLAQGGFVLLCFAALTFPFSVAACNIALAGCLITGLISGGYIKGIRHIWKHHRALTTVWLAYLALFPVGLLWSLDVDRGIQIIGRQWFWLLTPLLVEMLRDSSQRNKFFLALSLGLSMHLLFCLAQFHELVTLVDKAGSTASNPAGFIGHTSFGLVYGIWAAFLLHWSMFQNGWLRWATRLVALWAVGMIFLTNGRGGYIVVAALLLVMLWKLVRIRPALKLLAASFAVIIMATALSLGPGKERIIDSWHSIQAVEKGNFNDTGISYPEARFSLWYAAISGWWEHKPMGIGTGGFAIAANAVKERHPDLFYGGPSPTHPHNMLLQTLARWGPIGVLLLAALFMVWIREGWRSDWHANQRSGPASGLIALTGIALFVQGLTEPSFEQHFPGIFTALLLGAGLAGQEDKPEQSA